MSSPMDKTRRDRWQNNPGVHPNQRDWMKTIESAEENFTTTTTTTSTTTTTTSSSSTTTTTTA